MNARKVREDLGRAKACCARRDTERALFLTISALKELGGQIVTVGSDSHRCDRVGQYCGTAARMLADIFGYVCTFENRQPIFHKIG